MQINNRKKYDIFFCHPSGDRRKATLIVAFLKRIIREALGDKYSIFYSPEDLKKDRESKAAWRAGINKALKHCKCMIIYYTPNALNSKWMNYEIGAMASRSKTLIPITTGAVDLSKAVVNDNTLINIATDDIETLEDWVVKIVEELNPLKRNSSNLSQEKSLSPEKSEKRCINNWFSNPNNLKVITDFVSKIRTQTIYIIGSKPRENNDNWNNSLVSDLSKGLLEREFNLASSPSVKEVGYIVAKECLATPTRYTIAGLHRFESDLIKTSEISDESITKSIKMFRQRYLSDIDAIIVIGGKQNTMAEINATDERIQFFYLPCMGGVGEKLYNKFSALGKIPEEYPCNNCDICVSCPKIEALCDYIANKLQKNEQYKGL